MIQVCRFDDGGFVLHKIMLDGIIGHLSAWFDREGQPIDAEHFTKPDQTRPIVPNRHGLIWQELKRLGRIHKQP